MMKRFSRWTRTAAHQYRDVLEEYVKEQGPELNPSRYYFSSNIGIKVTTTKEETEQWLIDKLGFGRMRHPAQGLGSFPQILVHKRRLCPVVVRSDSWGATIIMVGSVCPQWHLLVSMFSESCIKTMSLQPRDFYCDLFLSPDIEAGQPVFPKELELEMTMGKWVSGKYNIVVDPVSDPHYAVRYRLTAYLME